MTDLERKYVAGEGWQTLESAQPVAVTVTAAELVAAGDTGILIAPSNGDAVIPFAWGLVASEDWVMPTNGSGLFLFVGPLSNYDGDGESVVAGKFAQYSLQIGGNISIGDMSVAIVANGYSIEGGAGKVSMRVSYWRIPVPE